MGLSFSAPALPQPSPRAGCLAKGGSFTTTTSSTTTTPPRSPPCLFVSISVSADLRVCLLCCLPLRCSPLLLSNYSSILWSRHVVCPAIPRNASPLPPNRSPMRPPAIPAPASPQPHLSPRPPLCPPCLCTSPVSRHLQRAAPRRRHLRHQEQCRHELRGLQAE